MYRKSFQFIHRTLMFAGVLNFAPSGFAQSQSFSYGGSMVDDMGLAVVGPVDVTLHFFSDPVQPEIFNVAVTLSPAQVGQLQLAPSLAIQVQAVNTSSSFNKTYPMQIVASVPRALSVPVDNVTLKYVGGVLTSVSSAGPAGATGAIGPAGPGGVSGYVVVATVPASYQVTSGKCGRITDHVQVGAWVNCPAGKVAVGGGGQCQIGGGFTLDSYPTANTTTGAISG